MRTLFDEAGLHVTDRWVQAGAQRYPIGEIDRVWAARPRGRRPATWLVAVLAVATVAAVVGLIVAFRSNPLLVIVGVPVTIVFVVFGGPLDLVTHRLENRPWQLYISARGVDRPLWSDNSVEVNKALRAIQRAREYHHDSRGRTAS